MNQYVTGAVIRELREKKNLTQAELAEKLNVSDKTVSKWETAKGYPDISLLEPIAQVFGVSITELISGNAVQNGNVSANMLGLSNAATPFGLEAMQHLQKENPDKSTASDDMITFVLINTASVQIIPTTVAQIRAKYGAVSPFDIVGCVWITSIATLIFVLILNAIIRRVKRCHT